MEEILFCKNGGCTAKLGAGALKKVLSKLPKKENPDLLVGFDSSDDAAVYQLSEDMAVVQTVDFFPPMVEDPYIFGQIAATNALSDIYAMGGEVKCALNIVCFPEKMDLNILGKILQGGNEKVMEAGGSLVGGHSIADDSVKYGMAVTGVVHPKKIFRNDSARPGDVLLLTKPLGVGIICAAMRMNAASKKAQQKAIESMTTLNKYASEVVKKYEVHACTDVTGFGFLVHLSEMTGVHCTAIVDSSQIPYFKECDNYIKEFFITGAAQKNRNFVQDKVHFTRQDFVMEELLYDPQTSGGLLVSLKPEDAHRVLQELHALGYPGAIVGRMEERKEYAIYVE